MKKLCSCLSDEIYKFASTTATHINILLQCILTHKMISQYLTTVCDHTDGFTKQYRCAYSIYLLSFIALEVSIIIDI